MPKSYRNNASSRCALFAATLRSIIWGPKPLSATVVTPVPINRVAECSLNLSNKLKYKSNKMKELQTNEGAHEKYLYEE